MASRPDELSEPVVVEIEDDFTRLSEGERFALLGEWLDSIAEREPIELPVSGTELLAEARAEMGW
jgi:hypothetical protein